ncbi:MAG: chloride channel protein [Flavobacteriales bacterium]|nr:chloride channel protein [Flavobacteriales bacterium]
MWSFVDRSVAQVAIVRQRYMGPRTSLVIGSVLIGLVAALCAIALKKGVHFTTGFANQALFSSRHVYLVLLLPCIGILGSVWITRLFLHGDLGRGLPNLLKDVHLNAAVVPRHKTWSQVVTSIVTMGFGGSAGLEAPLAITGAAIGSNTARWMRFGAAERLLLLASGTAAGVAAIFNAPIAGTVFALEIVLVNNALTLVVPVLIASASATLLSSLTYFGQPFVLITDSWSAAALPFYVLLAFASAGLSMYVIRLYHHTADLIGRITNVWKKAVVGSLVLGALIFLFPPLFGEGYDSVRLLLSHDASALALYAPFQLPLGAWNIVWLAVGLMLFKVVAASLTIHAGGNGGMFGPSLFIGAMLGFAFSHTVNLLGITQLNEVNFTVVGMAAVLSGTVHVPLTAIFLIAEITGGYALFVPLMITASLAFLISKYLHTDSIYGKAPKPAGANDHPGAWDS